MIRPLLAAAAALFLTVCATSKPVEAGATIEEIPNEPSANAAPADAGVAMTFPKLEAAEGFSVLLPGPHPEAQRNKVTIPAGDIVTAAWSVNVEGIIYSVSLADYPEKVVRARRPDVFLNEGRDGLVNQLKGQLREEQAIEIDGHPGKSFTVFSDAGEVRARNYLVGQRLYTLLVLYSPNLGAPRADEFLTSLTLTAPVQPIYKGAGMDGGTADGGAMDEMTDAADADAGTPMVDAGTPAAKPKKKKKK